jgi:S1-C subfamily serine protease
MIDNPTPEEPGARPAFSSTEPAPNPAPHPATQPDPQPQPAAEQARDHNDRPRRTGLRAVLAASALSAVLASGGTYALISMTPLPQAATQTPATAQPAVANPSTTIADGDLTSVIASAKESVVTVTSRISSGRISGTGVGSGLIVTSNGYILTNRHVVEGAQALEVQLYNGRTYPATIVKQLTDNDLALIKIDATGLKAATIGNSDQIEVGETALAIGSPLGTYTETVTRGIVSATGRDITVRDDQTGDPKTLHDLIQTDAAVNEGNSGGPLLDATGRVIGINTAVSASGQGLGFAIPINAAQSLVAIAQSSAT